jgi:hypothetical protein
MSDSVDWIVVLEAPLGEAQYLADQVRDWLVQEKIILTTPEAAPSSRGNKIWSRAWAYKWDADLTFQARTAPCGLEVAIGRRVFDAGGHGIDSLACPACGMRHDPDSLPWSDAVGAWHAGDDQSAMKCPACGVEQCIVAWHFDVPWALGNLGFGFWNWTIKERLVQEVESLIRCRCRLVRQHI